jgi:flagellar biosynthesis/type III secretory pathway ATPase
MNKNVARIRLVPVENCISMLRQHPPLTINGRIEALTRTAFEIAGLAGHVMIGDRVFVRTGGEQDLVAEIVAFRKGMATAAPLGQTEGLGPGALVQSRVQRTFGSGYGPRPQ